MSVVGAFWLVCDGPECPGKTPAVLPSVEVRVAGNGALMVAGEDFSDEERVGWVAVEVEGWLIKRSLDNRDPLVALCPVCQTKRQP